MSDVVVGVCSICAGRVTVPKHYMSVVEPVPTCQTCGATKSQPYGPVIEMTPRMP